MNAGAANVAIDTAPSSLVRTRLYRDPGTAAATIGGGGGAPRKGKEWALERMHAADRIITQGGCAKVEKRY